VSAERFKRHSGTVIKGGRNSSTIAHRRDRLPVTVSLMLIEAKPMPAESAKASVKI
jgi:hypothetical protein